MPTCIYVTTYFLCLQMGDEKKKKKGLPLKDMVKRKCHVCGRMYVNAKSVVRHIKDKHPLVFKDPNFKETLAKSKVTPKRKCPYCGKEFSGANYKHIKLCNRRPDLVLRPAQEPGQAPIKIHKVECCQLIVVSDEEEEMT